jgi:hypothetical protein
MLGWHRLLALSSVALPAIAGTLFATGDATSNAYGEVATFLRRTAAPGDLVVVTPEWNLAALRHFASTGLPVLAAANGAVALQAGARRAWVVSPPWGSAAPAPLGKLRLVEQHSLHGLRVDLLAVEDPQVQSSQSALRLFPRARAWVRGLAVSEPSVPCARDGERLRCGQEPWQWVGPETVTVQGTPRRCLWVHPISDKKISVAFPPVTLQGSVTLVTMLSDAATSRPHGVPVSVELFAGGQSLARLEHPFSQPVLRRRVSTPTGLAELRVDIGTIQDGMAHFCLDLDL